MQTFNSFDWYLVGALSKKPSDARPFARENFFHKNFKKWSKMWLHTKIQPPSYLGRLILSNINPLLQECPIGPQFVTRLTIQLD